MGGSSKSIVALLAALVVSACSDPDDPETAQPGGSSCVSAPAPPEAAPAWQKFLEWHAANAEACSDDYQWPSYECFTRRVDPSGLAAFTACMMSDGCNSISNEDACSANPEHPDLDPVLDPATRDWYEQVCLPKSEQCGYPDDVCSALLPIVRPEWRCAVVACINGDCGAIPACLEAVKARFPECDD